MSDAREIAGRLTKAQREVRILKRVGLVIPVVRLGIVGNWSMVRNANYRDAMPFVVSNKDWDRAALEEGA